MADRRDGPEFAGVFDIHVTVAMDATITATDTTAAADDGVGRLARWATGNAVKLTHIVLARGAVRSQPMLTLAGRGTLTRQRAVAATCVDRLRDEGFDVVRVKIEAAPWNEDVPRSAAAAVALTGCYFEHHVKVVVRDDVTPPAGIAQLAEIAQRHSAHVSRNARRECDDGSAERFVTQRCRDIGLSEAGRRFDALVTELRSCGFAVLETEREFVVYDSNPQIDKGWIEER
ncbi:hypothetical protein [Nonomuraea jiangxiensis]|uniref:Uncharacterized protein n=1 Tax=Nonomuraea jiangxiensis TaxID=633440 RepID=A0A1G8FNH8_9ACTN|nr:hypothetical protein [Nonomuraea jiangxiensis]SDH83641.1 hypothetical protein SAMN05421869_103373 [Nonomuraea jiangxiensis]